ncbi:hypothetical protein GCM10010307_69860 [Streptomyces vastus]|uniref:Berberine/berberine-like domain-containing protein n=2 Tax=Streptomyces vastus TaxID=285451 RepID=A0ABN3RMH4_9ACTN
MAHVAAVCAGDRPDAAQRVLTPLLGRDPLLRQEAVLAPYPALVPVGGAPRQGQGLGATRSGLLDRISPHTARSLTDALASEQVLMGQFRSVGGAVNDVSPSATAYAHRTQNFQLLRARARTGALPRRSPGTARTGGERRVPRLRRPPLPRGPRRGVPRAGPDRLHALKARYDPENVFARNFPLR